MVTENEMKDIFRGGYAFPPLKIRLAEDTKSIQDFGIDAFLDVTSSNRVYRFAAEFKSRSTPKFVEDGIRGLQRLNLPADQFPILVVPFLKEGYLKELESRQISGIDLCGNGVITAPGGLLVYRTGNPNKYPDSEPTRHAYRGTTSLVARTFLSRSSFRSLGEIESELRLRGGSVVLSTISKALKRMESDLVVDRGSEGITLIQPDKLLQKLSESYTEPKTSRTCLVKIKPLAVSPDEQSGDTPLQKLLASGPIQKNIALTGRSSINAYAVMGRQDHPVLYTSNVDQLLRSWGDRVEETTRFTDLEIRQTDDPTVYFDVRKTQNLPLASPVQAFLECSAGDKRERETASQIKEFILRELRNKP